MLTTIRYMLLTALRDKLFIGLIVASLLVFGVASFLGSTALLEQEQMAMVFASSSMRLVLLTGLILFICFHVRRAFDHKEVELILTRPISREAFVLSYWMGFIVIGLLLLCPVVILLVGFLPVNLEGLYAWTGSFILEMLIVSAFAFFSALILNSPVTSTMLCFGFYLISRMMGFFLFLMESPRFSLKLHVGEIAEPLLVAFSAILPRLDLFTQSEWLVYGPGAFEQWYIVLIQAVIYIPFLLSMAIFDFRRRQF